MKYYEKIALFSMHKVRYGSFLNGGSNGKFKELKSNSS